MKMQRVPAKKLLKNCWIMRGKGTSTALILMFSFKPANFHLIINSSVRAW